MKDLAEWQKYLHLIRKQFEDSPLYFEHNWVLEPQKSGLEKKTKANHEITSMGGSKTTLHHPYAICYSILIRWCLLTPTLALKSLVSSHFRPNTWKWNWIEIVHFYENHKGSCFQNWACQNSTAIFSIQKTHRIQPPDLMAVRQAAWSGCSGWSRSTL